MGWCEVVPGSVTNTSATLKTYIYDLYRLDPDGHWDYDYSCPDLSEVYFEFAALGLHEVPTPTGFQISPYNNHPRLSWGDVTLDINDLDGYHVYRKIGSQSWNRLTSQPITTTTFTDYSIDYSNRFSGSWTKYHLTTVAGGEESYPTSDLGLWGNQVNKQLTENESAPPKAFSLYPNYPNPFNPSTTIRYGLPEESYVSLVIYDMRGQVVQILEFGQQSAGWYDAVWKGETADGNQISTGIYFARLVADDHSQTIKLVYSK